MNKQGVGQYMCYCKHWGNRAKDLADEGSLCHMYFKDEAWGIILTNSVTFLISVINMLIRTVNVRLIDKIGFHTWSQTTSAVMTSIFISSFINTGIILLLTNADLKYSIFSWIPLNNQYSDLSLDWYSDIGTSLVKTMIIMAVFPYFEFMMWFSLKVCLRVADSGFYFFRT